MNINNFSREYGQIIVNNLEKHVKENLILDDSYMITDFKAKTLSITLANQDYEVTVKVKGNEAEILNDKIRTELDIHLGGSLEEDSEEEEDLDDEAVEETYGKPKLKKKN